MPTPSPTPRWIVVPNPRPPHVRLSTTCRYSDKSLIPTTTIVSIYCFWYSEPMKKSIKSPARLSSLVVEFEREEDGRWIAEIPKLPGVMAYGATKRDALQKIYTIAS